MLDLLKTIRKKLSLILLVVICFNSSNTISAFADESVFNLSLATFNESDYFPSYYSSVDLGYITPSENQWDTDSCWAFSTLGVLSAYSIKNGIHTYAEADYSEAHLAWFNGRSLSNDLSDSMYGDGTYQNNPYKSTGNLLTSVFTLAKGSGIAYEVNYPFNKNIDSMGNYPESDRYDRSAGILTEAKFLNGTSEIKPSIMEYGAVEVGIYYDPDKLCDTTEKTFNGEKYIYTGNCAFYNENTSGGGHEIIIVGWDDNYPKTNFKSGNRPSENGAWLCKNSWGPEWGENGLFWVSYENKYFINPTTYACVSGDKYDNIYQYDGYGFNRCLSLPNFNKTAIANVYTAQQTETIEAVGFYTYQNAVDETADTSTEITVSIYKNLPNDYTGPIFGSPVLTQTVFETHSGYHTVELSNSIVVEKDEIYSVVITVISDDSAVLLLEGNESDELLYDAQSGCSYISYDGSITSFFDSAKKYGGNVCIKTYTNNYDGYSVTGIKLDSSCVIEENQVKHLDVTLKPQGVISDIRWDTSNENVVLVDDNGVLTATGTGNAVVTASVENSDITASIDVTVVSDTLFIKWVIDGKTVTQAYSYGDTIYEPEVVVKEGYSFVGWDKDIPMTMPTKNLQFVAIFEPNIDMMIRTPSTTTISYGDSIILHSETNEALPAGWTIKWTANNGNFDYSVSDDGKTCTITPKKSGDTTFTAMVYDENGNEISKDTQTMTSKAGFFDKFVAFFKKLFGATKIFQQSINF